jgi:DNA repair protein RAD5
VMVEFTPAERQFYDALHEKSVNLFEGFIEAGTENKSWLAIFSLLNRLRQTCDHVALTVRAHLDEEDWNANIVQAGDKENADVSPAKTGNAKAVIDQKVRLIKFSYCSKCSFAQISSFFIVRLQQFLENLMGKFRNMQAESKTKKSVGDDYASQIAIMLNDAVRAKSSHLEQECAICLDPINLHDALVTPCIHIFCKGCLIGCLQSSANSQVDDEDQPKVISQISAVPHGECPLCKEKVDSSKILRLSQVDGELKTSYLADSQIPKPKAIQNTNEAEARQALENAIQGSSSSKLTAIIQELDMVWEEDPGSKVLIFSQYLGFLDLIQNSLRSSGISYSRLDGKLSLKQRVAVLDEFGKPQPENANSQAQKKIGSVLLVSMKAGGVGLNLVAARSVFIADPWWNAAVEDQCVSRIHRIGQTASKVRVRKFYVANSVEQRIVELQNRKKCMASEVLCDEGTKTEPRTAGSNKPSMDDFKILFRDG